MGAAIVVTFVGDDKPGLVNAISEKIAAEGATWVDSRLARLSGKFAGIVSVEAPAERLEQLVHALRTLDKDALRITVETADSLLLPRTPEKIVILEIVGADRSGIVRDVTRVLTGLGVNIEEFSSSVESAPFSGAELFRATARLRVPEELALDELRGAIERLATEIMVDLAVREVESPR